MKEWLKRSATILLIAASGCGLGDYQQRMDEQRKRVQAFDEANLALDDPIAMPTLQKPDTKLDLPAWPFDVYLRLPSKYGTLPKEKTPYGFYQFPCFRYAGTDPGVNLFVVAAEVLDAKGRDEAGKFTRESFRANIRLAMEDFYTRTYKTRISFQDKAKPQRVEVAAVSAYPDPAHKVLYDYYQLTDESNKNVERHCAFDIYIHEAGGRQACIVRYRPLSAGNRDAQTKAIETTLGTLDLGPNAAARRKHFFAAKGQ